jgi:hypothetical protein
VAVVLVESYTRAVGVLRAAEKNRAMAFVAKAMEVLFVW